MQSPFGCVIAGRPLISQFIPMNPTKCVADIAAPGTVNEITFFLMPTAPGVAVIPPGFGAILYYSVAPFDGWTAIGSIQTDKPSAVFHTGWATKDEVRSAPLLKLCVSLESLETIRNLDMVGSGVIDRFAFAQKVASDLYSYMCSFSSPNPAAAAASASPAVTVSPTGEMMLVPTRILEMWMERFARKYRMDPNFIMKQQNI